MIPPRDASIEAAPPSQPEVVDVVAAGPDVTPPMGRMLVSASGIAVLQAVSSGAGFVISVLLARDLGGQGYGVYALALAWSGFLAIPAIIGFDRFLVRGMAVYDVRSQWNLMKGLLRRTNQIVLAASLGVAATACVVAAVWGSPRLVAPFAVAMLLVPLMNLTRVRQSAMQALGRVVSGQLPEYLIRPLLILAGIVVLQLADRRALTPTSAVAINVVAVAIAFAVGAAFLRRTVPGRLRSAQAGYATREWLRASLPMMVIAGIWTANNYVATLLVGAISGPASAGVYSVIDKGSALIALILVAANLPLAPAVARLHATGDRAGLERTTVHVARAGLIASVPLTIAFIVFGGDYLRLFGSDFQTGTTALSILAMGQLVNAAAGPAGNVLMMTGHERAAVRGLGIGLLANVVIGIVLVPSMGVTGAAIGATASLVVWNVMLVASARRLVGVNASALGRRLTR